MTKTFRRSAASVPSAARSITSTDAGSAGRATFYPGLRHWQRVRPYPWRRPAFRLRHWDCSSVSSSAFDPGAEARPSLRPPRFCHSVIFCIYNILNVFRSCLYCGGDLARVEAAGEEPLGAVNSVSEQNGEQMVKEQGLRVNGPWRIRVLYDGDCPLCSREIRFLERRDRGRGRIQFEDIAGPTFDPGAYGLEAREVMKRIHGVLPDGTVVAGMEVFRRAYAAVGLGWLMAPTRWPGLRRLADLTYRIFARNRLRLTGRTCTCEAKPPQDIGTHAEVRSPSRA